MSMSMASLHMDTATFALPARTSVPNGRRSSSSAGMSPIDPVDPPKRTWQNAGFLQCTQCSYPLREPVTLPCGNSLCKKCIPELHVRLNISYPATTNRLLAFTCPFPSCKLEHVAGDCNVDVVLNKIMDRVQAERIRADMDADKELSETCLREAARPELDCQVCYSLLLDPLTTSCGHTLCRTCLYRVQDHSNICPTCRRLVALPPGATAAQAPSNALLVEMIASILPDALAARLEIARLDEAGPSGMDTPIFICTLSVPHTPTFLHIFEPKYRLMMRRAMETGERKFGMVLGNPRHNVQGDLGAVPFYQYGTMLYITNMQILPDGRSIIESIGTTRFRILKYGYLDGYMVGKVEYINDVSLTEEEAIEAAETSTVAKPLNFSAQDYFRIPFHRSSPQARPPILELNDLTYLSTQELMEIATGFVKKMREMSAPWLHRQVVQSYGECPDDPALFPWWFACVIPTSDTEKYKMLEMTTVRQRLKMCVVFATELERQRCTNESSSCIVL